LYLGKHARCATIVLGVIARIATSRVTNGAESGPASRVRCAHVRGNVEANAAL